MQELSPERLHLSGCVWVCVSAGGLWWRGGVMQGGLLGGDADEVPLFYGVPITAC